MHRSWSIGTQGKEKFCSATAADAGPRSWPPGRPPISLLRSHLHRPRLFAGEAIVRPRVGDSSPALRPKPRPHTPRTQREPRRPPDRAFEERHQFSSACGRRRKIAIKIERGGRGDDQPKANLDGARHVGLAGGRPPAWDHDLQGLRRRANCSSPAWPGRFGRRSHAHGRSSPSPATEPVRDQANLARPVFGTDRNSAHVKWRRVARNA